MNLEAIATKIRIDIVNMTKNSGNRGAHLGGSLSCVEILVSLYCQIMRYRVDDPFWKSRDRFFLSKAHAAMALYAVLRQAGFLSEEDINKALKDGSNLCEHPKMDIKRGIEISGGSLGQGLSIAVGTAIALKKKKIDTPMVYVLLGDGECCEGQIWEAAATASFYDLNNVAVIIDNNGLSFDGAAQISPDELEKRWDSLGFSVHSVNGHHIEEITDVLREKEKRPKAVIAKTIKGKGVSFAENRVEWHSNILTEEMYQRAISELK